MRIPSPIAIAATILLSTLFTPNPVHARRSLQHVNKQDPVVARAPPHKKPPTGYGGPPKQQIPLNHNTTKFAINGTKIPFVNFDIGESYAGLLPLNASQHDSGEMFFWFFPSDNALAGDEILIWLNGGPGCSSLEGLLQENGPFLWQYGTYRPVANPWTWVNLTNVVWVEQPIGTGFSLPNNSPVPQNELDVAKQFLEFWKTFVDTFGLHGKKVYITGESYAGYFVPYIADAMHNQTGAVSKTYYNLEAIMIFDPSTTYSVVSNDAPVAPFVDYWGSMLNLNDTFVEDLHHLRAGM